MHRHNHGERVADEAGHFIDRLSQEGLEQLKDAYGQLFYRTGIPFQVSESKAMLKLVTLLKPTFAKCLPTCRCCVEPRILTAQRIGTSNDPYMYKLFNCHWRMVQHQKRASGELCAAYSWMQAILFKVNFYRGHSSNSRTSGKWYFTSDKRVGGKQVCSRSNR